MSKVSEYLDTLQSQGRYTVWRDEIGKAVPGSPLALKAALHRLAQKKRVTSPRRGFYVIVPLEYRVAASPPASWFIDLMKYLGRHYYVGLLSAAALHGASHQKPQEFQVISNKPLRGIHVGRLKIRFIKKGGIEKTPTVNIQTETGIMHVSTPEATAFDLVRYVDIAGSLSNVATILTELAESLDAAKLLTTAQSGVELASVQRVGHLLESLGFVALVSPLWEWLLQQKPYPVLLKPGRKGSNGHKDVRWSVVVNEQVEVDVLCLSKKHDPERLKWWNWKDE